MITVHILNEVNINTSRSEWYPSDLMFLIVCINFTETFGTASLAPGCQYLTLSGLCKYETCVLQNDRWTTFVCSFLSFVYSFCFIYILRKSTSFDYIVLKDCSVFPSPCWKPKLIAVSVAGKREWQVLEVSRHFEIETASLKTGGLHVIMGDHFVAGGEFFSFSSAWRDICRVMMVQLVRKLLQPRVSQRSDPVQGNITRLINNRKPENRVLCRPGYWRRRPEGKSFGSNDIARIRVHARRHAQSMWVPYRVFLSTTLNHTDVNFFVCNLFNDVYSTWCVALKEMKAVQPVQVIGRQPVTAGAQF